MKFRDARWFYRGKPGTQGFVGHPARCPTPQGPPLSTLSVSCHLVFMGMFSCGLDVPCLMPRARGLCKGPPQTLGAFCGLPDRSVAGAVALPLIAANQSHVET